MALAYPVARHNLYIRLTFGPLLGAYEVAVPVCFFLKQHVLKTFG